MKILFAISILAFCALLWASFSIARHIRAGSRTSRTTATRETADTPHAQQAPIATRKAA